MASSDSESSRSRSSTPSRRKVPRGLRQATEFSALNGPQTEELGLPASRSVSEAAGSGAVQVKWTFTKDTDGDSDEYSDGGVYVNSDGDVVSIQREDVDEDAILASAMLEQVSQLLSRIEPR